MTEIATNDMRIDLAAVRREDMDLAAAEQQDTEQRYWQLLNDAVDGVRHDGDAAELKAVMETLGYTDEQLWVDFESLPHARKAKAKVDEAREKLAEHRDHTAIDADISRIEAEIKSTIERLERRKSTFEGELSAYLGAERAFDDAVLALVKGLDRYCSRFAAPLGLRPPEADDVKQRESRRRY